MLRVRNIANFANIIKKSFRLRAHSSGGPGVGPRESTRKSRVRGRQKFVPVACMGRRHAPLMRPLDWPRRAVTLPIGVDERMQQSRFAGRAVV